VASLANQPMDGNNPLALLVLHNVAELIVQVLGDVAGDVLLAFGLKFGKLVSLIGEQGFNLACFVIHFLLLQHHQLLFFGEAVTEFMDLLLLDVQLLEQTLFFCEKHP